VFNHGNAQRNTIADCRRNCTVSGYRRSRMAISLDGPDAESHDGFRRVTGSFARTLFALEEAREIGLETQVNTTVTRHNSHRLPEIAEIVERHSARLWSVFFLVTTGRALVEGDLGAEEYEKIFDFLYDLSKRASFDIAAFSPSEPEMCDAIPCWTYIVMRRCSQSSETAHG
jgi:MoaA/NifB/PqqE/SkfB family radical SAM enzyme